MYLAGRPEDQELTKQLIHHSNERTIIRAKLCKLIRENKHLFAKDEWMKKKMRLGYLGDLSDHNLVLYARTVYQNKAIKETLEMLS